MLNYASFAEAYGWTPAQVDEIDVVLLSGLSTIINQKNKSERKMIEDAGRRR